jgi:predicted  nucleic acid-binding Zn-ribbon protein
MSFEELLAVQDIDTSIDQLHHRRTHLPEREELQARQTRLAQIERRAGEVQGQRDEISAAEKALDNEITDVREKAAGVERQLYSGVTNVPKELEALQHEIGSLQRRQRDLEDRELELMEQGEPLDTELGKLSAERDAVDAEAIGLTAAIAQAEAAVDAELVTVEASRAEAAALVAPALLAEYERLRATFTGIGVARLIGNRCDGCHLTLPAVDVDRIRHLSPDEPVNCPECGRLLVR